MKPLSFRRLLWALPLLTAATVSPALAEAPPRAAESQAPRPAIWLLADEDTKIYLFGTIHMLPPGFHWRSSKLDEVVAEASELVVETYEPPGASEQIAAYAAIMMLDEPSPVLWRVPAKHRVALKAAILDTPIPLPAYSAMRTWAAGLVLGVSQLLGGYGVSDPDEAPGVEDYLEGIFRSSKRPISQVEKAEDVLNSFNTLPEDVQIALLTDGLEASSSTGEEAVDDHIGWATGDVEAMGAAVAESLPPAVFDLLVRKRNLAWTGWLVDRLETPGTLLFAVGAGHLAGPESVQAMLEGRGLKVTRID